MHLITHNSQLLAFFNNNKTKILKNGLRARIKGFTLISATISRFSFHSSFYFFFIEGNNGLVSLKILYAITWRL